jgi:AraC-like DNA-binding protein
MVLIPDHQLFHCRGDKPTPHFFCTFSVKSKLKADQPVPILFRPTGLEMELIGSAVGLFAPHVERDRIFHLCTALLYVVLSRPEIAWRQSAPASVEETIHYIEENYATPITIPRLARKAKVSTETLARSFKKFHGETLGQYILKIRVREAARWLLHSDAKIEQIAESTGLANRAYLSRVFKRITGESPAEFRRRHGRRQ